MDKYPLKERQDILQRKREDSARISCSKFPFLIKCSCGPGNMGWSKQGPFPYMPFCFFCVSGSARATPAYPGCYLNSVRLILSLLGWRSDKVIHSVGLQPLFPLFNMGMPLFIRDGCHCINKKNHLSSSPWKCLRMCWNSKCITTPRLNPCYQEALYSNSWHHFICTIFKAMSEDINNQPLKKEVIPFL